MILTIINRSFCGNILENLRKDEGFFGEFFILFHSKGNFANRCVGFENNPREKSKENNDDENFYKGKG